MSEPPKLMRQEDSDPPEPLPVLQPEPEHESSEDEDSQPINPPPKIVKIPALQKRAVPLDEPPALHEYLPEKLPALPELQREDFSQHQEHTEEHEATCCEEMAVIRERTQHVEGLLESLHQVLTSLLKQRNKKHLEDRDRRARLAREGWSQNLSQAEEMARVGQKLDYGGLSGEATVPRANIAPRLALRPGSSKSKQSLAHSATFRPILPKSSAILKQEPPSPPPLKQIKLEPVFDQPSPPSPQPVNQVDSEQLIKELLLVKGKKVELVKLAPLPSFKDYNRDILFEAADELSRDGLLTATSEDPEIFTKTSPELLSPEELEPYNVPWKDYIAAYYEI